MNDKLTHLQNAIELDDIGEDGSGYLSLTLGDFELQQLRGSKLTDQGFTLVRDAQNTRTAVRNAAR